MTQTLLLFEWTRYITATGEIIQTGGTTNQPDIPASTGDLTVIPGQFAGDQFWFNPATEAVEPRPVLDVADRAFIVALGDTVVVQLPVGTVVREGFIDLGSIDDGTLEITPTQPGTRTFQLTPPFPHRVGVIRVTAS